jgi:hypothetical protein
MINRKQDRIVFIAVISIFLLLVLISGCVEDSQEKTNTSGEATVFEGHQLTPISKTF